MEFRNLRHLRSVYRHCSRVQRAVALHGTARHPPLFRSALLARCPVRRVRRAVANFLKSAQKSSVFGWLFR